MRRFIASCAAALIGAATLTVTASPAAAAGPSVVRDTTRSVFAAAGWRSDTETTEQFAFVQTWSVGAHRFLEVEQHAMTLATDGTVLTDMGFYVDVSDGFDLQVDATRLTAATVAANDLPVSICSFDATVLDGNKGGDCVDTTIDVSVTWTATGPVERTVDGSRTIDPHGVVNVSHGVTSLRQATAAGVIGAMTYDATTQYAGHVGARKGGYVVVCFDATRCLANT